MTTWRPGFAGLVTTVAVGLFWLTVHELFSGPDCASTQTQPYGCLGGEFLAAAVGGPLLAVVVALALAGKGAVHSILGALVSLVLGWQVVSRVLSATDYRGPDFVGQLLTAPAAGLVAVLWAAYAPVTSRPGDADARKPDRGESPRD